MSFILRMVVLFLALALDAAFAAAPTIANPTAVPGANGTATLSVDTTSNGAQTTVTFNYGLTTAYGSTATALVPAAAVAQPTPVNITGLIGGQTYHFQVTATNADGAATPTADQTFVEPTYATTGVATPVKDHATLRGTVSAFGVPGKVHFEYGSTIAYLDGPTPDQTTTPTESSEAFSAEVTGLMRNTEYHFRIVFVDDATMTPVYGADATFVTNNAPVANTDTINAAGSGPTTINPLVNDTDIDGDYPLDLVDVATQPEHGTAVVNGNKIVYTPDGTFTGFDTFTYTVADSFGKEDTGTINIRSIRTAFSGTHGGLIKNSVGKEIGYFTVTATSLGTFTGIAIIDGNRYVVSGTISPEGIYRGFATGTDSVISVFIFPDNGESSTKLTALFDSGRWYSELTLSPDDRTVRSALTGRYNAGIAAGGSGSEAANGNDPGTPPDGTGWLAIRVSADATARIKGQLSDGVRFSTRGTVNIVDGVPTLTFYQNPDDLRFSGTLTLNDQTVGGTTHTHKDSSGEGLYPRGYDIVQSVDGSHYIPPEPHRRVLDTFVSRAKHLTISFSGGPLDATISRDLELENNDHVKVLNAGEENLTLKINRKSGRFEAGVTIDANGTRLKANGVMIQAVTTVTTVDFITTKSGGTGGHGIGTFKTSVGTGTVTIEQSGSGGSGGSPTPTPTPTPVPLPTTAP